MREMTLGEIFTDDQINKALTLLDDVDAIEREIVIPGMDGINERTGQENNPRYVAYMLQAGLNEALKQTERDA